MAAAFMDMKTYKVKNQWLIFGFAFGAAVNLSCIQWIDAVDKLLGVLVPMLLIGLYRYGMLGAADIKLLAMSGFYLGFWAVIYLIGLTFLFAAVLSVYRIVTNRHLLFRFFYFLDFLRGLPTNHSPVYMDFSDKDKAACIHMTVPMAISAAVLYIKIL